jgi:hypothetical protein
MAASPELGLNALVVAVAAALSQVAHQLLKMTDHVDRSIPPEGDNARPSPVADNALSGIRDAEGGRPRSCSWSPASGLACPRPSAMAQALGTLLRTSSACCTGNRQWSSRNSARSGV